MKLIKDISFKCVTKNGNVAYRYRGIYECPFCGKHFETEKQFINTGRTKSCGCQNTPNIKHGLSDHHLSATWRQMKTRCFNIKHKQYENYGGRGITVCDEWKNDLKAFYDWSIKNGYIEPKMGIRSKLDIDRKDNNGNYEPNNCRWVSHSINLENTRLLHKNNKTGFRCVYQGYMNKKGINTWRMLIRHNGILYRKYGFLSDTDAALAYNNFVIDNNTNHPLNVIPTQL